MDVGLVALQNECFKFVLKRYPQHHPVKGRPVWAASFRMNLRTSDYDTGAQKSVRILVGEQKSKENKSKPARPYQNRAPNSSN